MIYDARVQAMECASRQVRAALTELQRATQAISDDELAEAQACMHRARVILQAERAAYHKAPGIAMVLQLFAPRRAEKEACRPLFQGRSGFSDLS